jgi:hypothetical protein
MFSYKNSVDAKCIHRETPVCNQPAPGLARIPIDGAAPALAISLHSYGFLLHR